MWGGGGGDENLDILIEVLARDLETGGSTTNVEISRLDNLDGEGVRFLPRTLTQDLLENLCHPTF